MAASWGAFWPARTTRTVVRRALAGRVTVVPAGMATSPDSLRVVNHDAETGKALGLVMVKLGQVTLASRRVGRRGVKGVAVAVASGPVPWAFTARTASVYVVPGVSWPKVWELASGPSVADWTTA